MERWNNRLTLQGQSPLEEYKRNHLTLVCHLDIAVADERSVRSISCNDETCINHLVPSIVFSADIKQRRSLYDWKQQPVLVENVEIVESTEGIIPSLVRFYDIHNVVTDSLGGLRYQSAIDGTFQFLRGFSEWESGVRIVEFEPPKNHFIDSKIQSTFKVVDGIPHNQRKFFWHGFSYCELKALLSSLRVSLNDKRVEVCLRESPQTRMKITDVLLGPFNL